MKEDFPAPEAPVTMMRSAPTLFDFVSINSLNTTIFLNRKHGLWTSFICAYCSSQPERKNYSTEILLLFFKKCGHLFGETVDNFFGEIAPAIGDSLVGACCDFHHNELIVRSSVSQRYELMVCSLIMDHGGRIL